MFYHVSWFYMTTIPTATKGTLMIKFKLEQQHRPFWGWVERHLTAFVVADILGVCALVYGYVHFDDLVNFLHHHL